MRVSLGVARMVLSVAEVVCFCGVGKWELHGEVMGVKMKEGSLEVLGYSVVGA